MLRFKIRPRQLDIPVVDVEALDESAMLSRLQRMNGESADVERNGVYAFSVRLEDSGLWSVCQRQCPALAPEV